MDLRGEVNETWLGDELDEAAGALADSMLYMKFVQGIPVVGAAGGLSNASTMRKISKYADLKYHKRMIKRQLAHMTEADEADEIRAESDEES